MDDVGVGADTGVDINADNNSTDAASSKTATSIETGDNSNFFIWCLLLVIALGAATGLIMMKRKIKRN